MNLKEAFRYQNKLQNLMDEAEAILNRDRNVTKVENTALRHKVNPDAEDETTVEKPDTEYAEQITEIAVFLMFLLNERERLTEFVLQTVFVYRTLLHREYFYLYPSSGFPLNT